MAIAGAAALAAAGTAGTVGAGVAGAATNTGANAGAPFFNGPNASEQIRGSGSDTTFFMMQKISDIFTGAGLYGCQLVSAGSQTMFGGASSTTGNVNYDCQAQSADIATTDDNDNWNRIEVSEGVNSVGSGAGQGQLCGGTLTPDTVNFARSSKPSANTTGCNEQELGYAKDGVPIVDFPTINPSTFGTSTFATTASAAVPKGGYDAINGGVVGPVAAGWLPADNPAGSANNGTKLGTISNVGAKDTSVAFRLWCATSGSGTEITDWGQLTNLGPNLEVNVDTVSGSPNATIDVSSGTSFPSTIAAGQAVTDPFATVGVTPFASGTTVSTVSGGSITLSSNATATGTYTLIFATGAAKLAQGSGEPIGVPIRLMGVNTASGTEYTFSQFAQGQTADTAGCPDGSGGIGMNANAANDPNASTAASGNPYHSALENNAHQLELFSQADFPGDTVDQAIEEATTLYFMSQGVYNTNSYVGQTTIGSTNFSANLIGENGSFASSTTELNNSYPTSRTLSNIINSVQVTRSTAEFMDWICDSNTNFNKGTDLNTGQNYDTEIGNIISTQYGFARLSDMTKPTSVTPADNTIAPNDDCVAKIAVTADGTDNNVTAASGTFPTSVLPASAFTSAQQTAGAGTVTGTGVPTGTTVTSAGGGSTISLSATLPAGSYTLEFFGVPGVTSASANQ